MVTSQILRKPDLARLTGLSPRTIDRMEKRGEFPRRFRVSVGTVGWRSEDVQRWIEDRAATVSN